MDPLSRLMLFVHALRKPTEPSPVNVELTKRQNAVQERIDRLTDSYQRTDAQFRAAARGR